jgi:hypothetical protein
MIAPGHFDTKMPDDADAYQTAKWKLGMLIVRPVLLPLSFFSPR